MSRIAYVNGRYLPLTAAQVRVEDRGFQFGDGVYEVVHLHRGRFTDEDKHLNRLEQVMARAEWRDPTIHEGILLDAEDHVVSAISSNIFIVSGKRLLTPRMDRCGVRGVMRSAILNAFRERCEQRRITLDMLPEADEIFVCNAVRGIFPVTRIDHWQYEIGPVTREVQQWLEAQ